MRAHRRRSSAQTKLLGDNLNRRSVITALSSISHGSWWKTLRNQGKATIVADSFTGHRIRGRHPSFLHELLQHHLLFW